VGPEFVDKFRTSAAGWSTIKFIDKDR